MEAQTPKSFLVLTEETPNIDEIRIMLALEGINLITSTNNDIIPKITLSNVDTQQKKTFAGEWLLSAPECTICIKLFKGTTSSVDYMLFHGDHNSDNGNAGEALCVLESTKTGDKSSRNTAVYQRICKFTTYDKMYPQSNSKKVMFWNNSMWGDKLTQTAVLGLRLMDTLNVRLFSNCGNGLCDLKEKYQISPFDCSDDLIEFKNGMKRLKGNRSIHMNREGSQFHISLKLDKGEGKYKGIMSHDPNVGFLSGAIHCFEKMDAGSKYMVDDHGIGQKYFDKPHKSKLWHSINGIDVAFSGRDIKFELPQLPGKYFIVEDKMTEKLCTILCQMTSKTRTIFSNHGGCALTGIEGPDGIEESVGQKMPRPDIMFADDEKKKINIVEGKVEKELLKGIKQLSDAHLEGFIKKVKRLYPDYEINKWLCITISDIRNIDKYADLEFPIKFALDRHGCFIDLR